jgi:hypothetical protein
MVDKPMGKPGNGFASRVSRLAGKFGKERASETTTLLSDVSMSQFLSITERN